MKKEQQKWIIIGIAGAGLIYLYFSFLFLPTSNEVKKLKSEYESSKKLLEEAEQKVSSLPLLEKDAIKLKEELYITLKRLPFEEDLPGLLKTISNIAIDVGVNIVNFEPQKQIQKDFYTEIPFKLSFTSSYHKLGGFLNNLSYQVRLMNAIDIQLSAASNVAGTTISGTLILTSYITKEKAEEVKQEQKYFAGVSREFAVKPFYLYDRGNRRDPFKPLSIIEITAGPKYVPINTLRLTGIISLPNVKTAMLEDVSAGKYTLTDGVLYANDMSIIDDVTGTIEKDKVELKQIEKETKKMKTVILEIKKEKE